MKCLNMCGRRKIGSGKFYDLCRYISSCRATSTDIRDPLSPLFPIVHRLWQVFRATSHILT